MVSIANLKRELVSVVGSENVVDDSKTLEEYSKDYSLLPSRKPIFVLKPSTEEEICRLVKLANKYNVPLVPRSSGVGFYG
ncbi:MAG: hypothetical protein QXH91_03080, partial [Candidatus Bathyarchaeia archaeon]